MKIRKDSGMRGGMSKNQFAETEYYVKNDGSKVGGGMGAKISSKNMIMLTKQLPKMTCLRELGYVCVCVCLGGGGGSEPI